MMVYFLRHGIAVDAEEWKGREFDRPLTDEGVKKMEREAKTIAKLALELDLIVTSPLVRAKQTADIVASALTLQKRLVEDERVGLGFDSDNLAKVITHHRDANAILLVGHEPSMSQVIGEIIGSATVDMKKGALACVDLFDMVSLQGQLKFLLPPKVLAL